MVDEDFILEVEGDSGDTGVTGMGERLGAMLSADSGKQAAKIGWGWVKYAIVITIGVIIILTVIWFLFSYLPGLNAAISKVTETTDIGKLIQTTLMGADKSEIMGKLLSYIGNILYYIFKFVFGLNIDSGITDSNIIIIIASWFVFFLVLKDLIKVFGMMKGSTPSLISFFIVVIMAHLGVFSGLLFALLKVFSFLLGASAIGVLASIIWFALVANWGITRFGGWMMRRRAMLEAAKIKAGGKKLKATIGALLEAGEAFEE